MPGDGNRYRRRVVDDRPYAPPQPEPDVDSNRERQASDLQTAYGCSALLLMMCLPLVVLGWYQLSHRDWIKQLDMKAKNFNGDVYNGRRDASDHFMISCHDPQTSDFHVPEIVSLGEECISGGAQKLHIDVSKTSITDDSIEQFAALVKLDTLDLSDTLVSRSGVARVRAKMPNTVIKDDHNFR